MVRPLLAITDRRLVATTVRHMLGITVLRLPAPSRYQSQLHRHLFRFMSSRCVQARATYGHQVIGDTLPVAITGYLAPGWFSRLWV